jgi:hypothetical protein
MMMLVFCLFMAVTATGVAGAAPAARSIEPQICLNMIVRNEAHVIERALRSALPLIHTWAIVDTGSEDDTAERIEKFFKEHDVPGRLYHRTWRNFGENRQEALTLVHDEFPDVTHVLFLDADDVFESPPTFSWPESLPLRQSFRGSLRAEDLMYPRLLLVRNNGKCAYDGVLHEALSCPPEANESEPALLERLGIRIKVIGGGARSRNPNKYADDARLLEEELRRHPDDPRNTFYLAQCYRLAQQPEKALAAYMKRVELRGWEPEVYRSYIEAARLMTVLKLPVTEVTRMYTLAYAAVPVRLEALHGLARYLRDRNLFAECFMAAQLGKNLMDAWAAVRHGMHAGVPSQLLGAFYLEPWIYQYGMLDEFAICAHYTNHLEESLAVDELLLRMPELPLGHVERIKMNRAFTLQALGRTA